MKKHPELEAAFESDESTLQEFEFDKDGNLFEIKWGYIIPRIKIDNSRCTQCFKCLQHCPAHAIDFINGLLLVRNEECRHADCKEECRSGVENCDAIFHTYRC